MADDMMEFVGVAETMAKDKWGVRVTANYIPLCAISGKIRQSGIKITIGDRVRIAVSPYNLQLGRITFRIK